MPIVEANQAGSVRAAASYLGTWSEEVRAETSTAELRVEASTAELRTEESTAERRSEKNLLTSGLVQLQPNPNLGSP